MTDPGAEIDAVFTAACVEAILAGRKRQARRVARVEDVENPLGRPGQRLRVRARGAEGTLSASVVVVIDDARREPLAQIGVGDAVEESAPNPEGLPPRESFAVWWDSLHSRPGSRWADNPMVWMVRFHLAEPRAPRLDG